MAELLSNGAVFIHVPKTGGTWVTRAMRHHGLSRGQIGWKHALPEHIDHVVRYHGLHFLRRWAFRGLTPGALRAAFKFVFVRNPVTWYESWWKFRAGNWDSFRPQPEEPQRPIDDCGNDDFDTFLGNVLDRHPGHLSRMYARYTDRTDFVGRYERLLPDLLRALAAAGAAADASQIACFPQQNISRARLGLPEWDPVTLARLIAAERDAIERYGYWDEVDMLCRQRVSRPLTAVLALADGAGAPLRVAHVSRRGQDLDA